MDMMERNVVHFTGKYKCTEHSWRMPLSMVLEKASNNGVSRKKI